MSMWYDVLNWLATAYFKNKGEMYESTIQMAEAYLGKTECKDYWDLQMLLGVDPRKTAWCAAFVNAIEVKCGRPGTHDLMAKSYLNYGAETDNPVPGDIVVFTRGNPDAGEGHVAYFSRQTDDMVYCLGGNQDNMVKYKWYSKEHMLSIRHPYE